MRKIKRRKKKLNRPVIDTQLIMKNCGIRKNILTKRQILFLEICQNDLNLMFYLTHLINISIHFLEKNKNNTWFFILQNKFQKDFFYIEYFQKKMNRSRMDIKLEELRFIETIRKGHNNRKYYKIQWQNIDKKIHLRCISGDTPYYTSIIYNSIYNSNKLKSSYNSGLPDGKHAMQFASQTVSYSSRIITRRQDKYIDNTISHWSSLGTPFAKVTTSNIKPLLKKIIKSESDSKEVIKVIDKAFTHINNPEFRFKTKANMAMKSFFVRGNYHTPATEFLRANKRNSWFTLFKLSSDTWLDENLHKTEIINNMEVFDFISNYFGNRNNKKEKLVRASNKMALWMKVNSYDLRTMSMDFDNFMHDKYPDIRDFEVYWLISDKFWNNQFAKYIVNFGRFKNIDEVKKI